MGEKVLFNREIAVREGLRDRVEINKDNFKRPYHLTRKWQKKWLFNHSIHTAALVSDIKKYYKDKDIKKLVNKILAKERLISLKDLLESGNITDKTILVYVEKYSDNVYTVREDYEYNNKLLFGKSNNFDENFFKYLGRERVIADLYCNQFFNIAGCFVAINLDKKDGKYYFKHVIPTYLSISVK